MNRKRAVISEGASGLGGQAKGKRFGLLRVANACTERLNHDFQIDRGLIKITQL
jgi:hypothetical protein